METKETYGFYGGKFFPMHKGHLHCIEAMSKKCDHGMVIMFINGKDERDYYETHPWEPDLSIRNRIAQLKRAAAMFPNVEWHIIDCWNLRKPDGTEDWDAETPLVREVLPHIDYVFSSEPDYDGYFEKAYPEAEHVIVDVDRDEVPISATMIRNMKQEDRKQWMV